MSEGISVVVPAFNYGHFIAETIASVLGQTHENLELLIVDDGSTDDTRKVVQRFSDSRVRYLYQSNQGLSAARNTGIANARFGYVAFLDADDLWLPEMLAKGMERFLPLPSDYGVVACSSLRIKRDGSPLDPVPVDFKIIEREIFASDIAIRSRFGACSIIVKSNVFKEVGGFDTSLRSSEDRDMWIRIAAKYRIHYYSDSPVLIRRHAENMSKHADRMRINMRKVLRKYFQRVGILSPRKFVVFLKAYAFNQFEIGWMYYDEKRAGEGVRAMLLSFVLWPCFFNPPKDLNEPRFFRLRALGRFLLVWMGLLSF